MPRFFPNSAVSVLIQCVTITLEFFVKAYNIYPRRSSGVRYPRSFVGEGTFIEAAAFAGKIAHISLN
jgi:hypothetical protein